MRTTVAASAVVGGALVLGAAGLLGVLRRSLEDNVVDAARLRALDVVAIAETGPIPEQLSVEEDDDGDEEETFIQVVDGEGTVTAASRNVAGTPAATDLRPGDRERVSGVAPSPEDPYLVVAEGGISEDGERLTVLVGRALEPVDETLDSVIRVLGLGLPALLALVAATTWVMVGRALRPVGAITTEVRAITGSGLDRRVPEPAALDEVGELARTMNAMLGRLESSRDRQRRFVSDASHELRTPIASMRHQLEVAIAHPADADLPALAEDLLGEDLRMQQLVDDLLLLARADESFEWAHVPVDLDDLALDAAHDARRSASSVEVDAAGVQAARVLGDRSLLAIVVRNLVDNAVRHATGRVAISVAHEPTAGTAVLCVDDDGPGVPPADRARVFERFTRLDDARTRSSGGTGLGLSIVAELTRLQGGTVQCTEAPAGGARFEVRLPASDL